MSKAKIVLLNKYIEETKNRLASKDTPSKHVGHEESYKAYLESELKKAMRKVEALKLEIVK